MKEKFYTSIYSKGNFVYYMGYDDGIPVKQKIEYKPHLFINNPSGEYTLFNSKQKLDRKDFDSIASMKEYVKKYKDISSFGIYGCSDVVRQYTAENFVGEIHWDYKKVQLKFIDIETTVEHLTVDPETKVKIRKSGSESVVPAKKLLIVDDETEVYDDELNDWVLVGNSTFIDGGFPEPSKAEEEITLITLIDNSTGKINTWSLFDVDQKTIRNDLRTYISENFKDDSFDDTQLDFRYFQDEKSLLRDFIIYFKSTRIDFLTGWNSELFDIPYIINRIKKVFSENVVNMLSPWGIVNSRIRHISETEEAEIFDILGITHLDSMDMYKKFNPGGKDSFALTFIATEELGVGKLDMPGESFKENYIKYPTKFCLYNIIDVYLLYKLEQKMSLAFTAMELSFIGKCQFGDSLSAMRFWESFIYNYFKSINVVEQYTKNRNTREDIIGGYVSEPRKGKFGWNVSVDGESLYPSVMIQNNLSPETFYDKLPDIFIDELLADDHIRKKIVPEGYILSGNGILTRKDIKGFIPYLVEYMFDSRKQTKNKMLELKKEAENIKEDPSLKTDHDLQQKLRQLEIRITVLDVKQKAFKVAANSLFGIQGLPYFKYYNSDMAEAITSTGQTMIRIASKYCNEILNNSVKTKNVDYVIYNDTDSIYLDVDILIAKVCPEKTDTEKTSFIEKYIFNVLQPELNKKLKLFVASLGSDNCRMNFKLECISPSGIWLGKKKYALHVLYAEGVRYPENSPYLKVTGLEIVRSSTPMKIRKLLKESVKICLSGTEKDMHKFISDMEQAFPQMSYSEVSFPRGVNGLSTYADERNVYKKGTPIHVRGSLLYNNILRKKGLDKKYPLIREGEKIKYVYLKMPNTLHQDVISFPGTLPQELDLRKYVDYRKQLDKTFIAPIENMLNTIGWTPREIVTFDM